MKKIISYIALGGNLNNPRKQLQKAMYAISMLQDVVVLECSSLYESAPLQTETVFLVNPNYCNAVIKIETSLTAVGLLNQLQELEAKQGRVRLIRWQPRIIDLDILLFGNQQINMERLTIPHSQMHLRDFVLFPLLEIDSAVLLPDGTSVKSLVANMSLDRLVVLSDSDDWVLS